MNRPFRPDRRRFLLAIATLTFSSAVHAQTPAAHRQRWSDPALQARIDRNIEAHRKGDASIAVVDAAGRPVSGAQVKVRQTRHSFLFGCNAFVLGQIQPEESARRYDEAFARLFNFATVPFYWEGTEPAKGELRYQEAGSRDIWRRPPPDRFRPWAEQHGITLKGHPLLWHAYNPPWLPKDSDELRELYRKRFREIATRYGGKIPVWDVVNESLVCPKTYPLFTPERDYVRWAFQEVAPLFPPETTLMINEVNSHNFQPAAGRYFEQVKALRAQGAAVRGIGFQCHYFRRERLDAYLASPNCDPGKLLDVYEKFAEFKLPLYITEITIPSAGPGGDDLQAEVVRDHYRLWFSASMMAGITWWNLGDGTAVKGENEAQGGLLDAEFRPKPAYRALDELINNTWMTRATVQTDSAGSARFRGFHGTYEVTIESGGRSVRQTLQLRKDSANTWTLKM